MGDVRRKFAINKFDMHKIKELCDRDNDDGYVNSVTGNISTKECMVHVYKNLYMVYTLYKNPAFEGEETHLSFFQCCCITEDSWDVVYEISTPRLIELKDHACMTYRMFAIGLGEWIVDELITDNKFILHIHDDAPIVQATAKYIMNNPKYFT